MGSGTAVAVGLVDVPEIIERPLVLELGGALPVSVDADIWVAALSDGERTAIGVYNEHFSEARTAKVKLGNIAPLGKRVATNVHRGTQEVIEDSFSVTLPSKGWNFFLIERPDSVAELAPIGTLVESDAYASEMGMSFLKLVEEKKTTSKRKKDEGVIYVAVFRNHTQRKKSCDYGAEAIMQKLSTQRRLTAEWVDDLSANTIEFYDVVVVPNMMGRAPNLADGWEANVREFVMDGGGAMLVHHSAGWSNTSEAMFPEVATVNGHIPMRGMEVVADHAVVNAAGLEKAFPNDLKNPAFAAQITQYQLAVGTVFGSGFPDYMPLAPGKAGTVVINSVREGNLGGDPTVVVGKVGTGRVVLCGMDIGASCQKVKGKWVLEESLSAEEASVLVNSVYWLGQR